MNAEDFDKASLELDAYIQRDNHSIYYGGVTYLNFMELQGVSQAGVICQKFLWHVAELLDTPEWDNVMELDDTLIGAIKLLGEYYGEMQQKPYHIAMDLLATQRRAIMEAKRHDYTVANEDVLTNFKMTAKILCITPKEAWGVHFLKHVFALITYARYGSISSESMEGRLIDIWNYLDIYRGLWLDGALDVQA